MKSKTIENYEILYEKYKRYIFYIAHDILHASAEVEDACQECFLKMATLTDKLMAMDEKKQKTYIATMIRNICFDIHRKNQKITVIEPDHQTFLNQEAENSFEQIYEKETLKRIEHCFRILMEKNEMYARVLSLRYYFDSSEREISQLLDISETNCSTMIFRARRKMRDIIKRCDKELYHDKTK